MPTLEHIEWRVSPEPVPYREALAAMDARNSAVEGGGAQELIWSLEHPPVYTAGTSAAASELLDPRFEVVEAGRGGRYTYHGPGQRVTYTVLDLRRRGKDVRRFVHGIEGWAVDALARFGVESWTVPQRVGIWTQGPDGREAKIGAIGVRVRKWVTMHGFAVDGAQALIKTLADLGIDLAPEAWDEALRATAPAFLEALERQDAR